MKKIVRNLANKTLVVIFSLSLHTAGATSLTDLHLVRTSLPANSIGDGAVFLKAENVTPETAEEPEAEGCE